MKVMGSSGPYAVLSNYGGSSSNTGCYTATSAGITTAFSVPTSYAMAIAPTDSSKVVILGFDSSSNSFAYYYNPSGDIKYNVGAAFNNVYFANADKYASARKVWIAGYLHGSLKYAFVATLEQATAVGCGTGATNYFNKACYPSISGSTCFGLCVVCLIADNIDSCSTVGSNAYPDAVVLFSGRCPVSGQHYYVSASPAACTAVTSASCHTLCGGECFASGDATKCAHHCTGAALEPYIDDSELGSNTCKCRTGTAFSSVDLKCEACYPLCGTLGCGSPADSARCLNCVSSATATVGFLVNLLCCACDTNYVLVGATCQPCFVLCNGCLATANQTQCTDCLVAANVVKTGTAAPYTCACGPNTVLSGNTCLACHELCNSCSTPSDNTQCTDCAALPNVQKSGSAAPYTCACAVGTVYDGGLCVYESGCHPLCQGKCTAKGLASSCAFACNPTATSIPTTAPSVYSCTCPSSTAFNGTACASITDSGCSPLCAGGCTGLTQCVSCVSQTNVVSAEPWGELWNCTCAAGTSLTSDGVCAYSEGCYEYCQGCVRLANSSSCVACVSDIVATAVSATEVSCVCPSNTTYYKGSCVSIVSSGCSPLCGTNGTCIYQNDPTTCVTSCHNSSSVEIKTQTHEVVSCGCVNGTKLSASIECVLDINCDSLCEKCLDADTCLACPHSSGMTLADGKCICAVSQGYVMVSDPDSRCIQSSSTAGKAVEYVGYLAAGFLPDV